MRRRITVAVLACASLAAGAPLASGHSLEAKYRVLRAEVVKKHGKRAPGRNIVRDGVRTRRGARPALKADITQSIEVLRRMLAPPAPPASSSSNSSAIASSGLQSPATSSPSSGSAGLPACADESHGNYSTGPENTNPSSGATGRWQTLRSHYSSGGVCAGLTLSPSGQDACAHRIYSRQGASAWVNCG